MWYDSTKEIPAESNVGMSTVVIGYDTVARVLILCYYDYDQSSWFEFETGDKINNITIHIWKYIENPNLPQDKPVKHTRVPDGMYDA